MTVKCYIKESKLTILLVFVMAVVVNAQRIFVYNIGYDTAEYLLAPDWTASVWMSYGRFALAFMERFCRGMYSSLLLVNLLAAINIGIYTILFLYFLNMKSEQVSQIKDIVIGLVFVSCPIFLEQYYFTLQVVEMTFAMILFMVSILLTQKFLDEKKVWQAVVAAALLVFTFGIYQAFANMYIVAVLAILVREGKETFQENFFTALKCAVLWIIGIAGYVVIKKITTSIFGSVAGYYIDSQIAWSQGLSVAIRNIASTCVQVIIGYGHVLNLAFTACGIYILVKIIKDKTVRTWNTLLWLFLFISPLLLYLVTASTIAVRTLMGIPMVVAFVFHTYWKEDKAVTVLLVLTILSQLVNGQLLLYSDNVRYKEDLKLAEAVYEACGGADATIVYAGVRDAADNPFSWKGQAIGQSFFEWSADMTDVDNYQASNFMLIHGLSYHYPTEEQILKGETISFTAAYPQDGYIVKEGDCYYINLGVK